MITSRQNETVKHLKRLLESTDYRHKNQAYILETENAIVDSLTHIPNQVEMLYSCKPNAQINLLANKYKIPTVEVAPHVMSKIHHAKTNFGTIAVCKIKYHEFSPLLNKGLFLYLDHISNPDNIGAIIRNAICFNASGIILSPECADPYHPTALRASTGNVFQCPIYLNVSLSEPFFSQYEITTLDSNAEESIESYTPSNPTVIVLGSETGLKSTLPNHAKRLKIPQSKNIDSLNVAVSSGIMLYQIDRNRRDQ